MNQITEKQFTLSYWQIHKAHTSDTSEVLADNGNCEVEETNQICISWVIISFLEGNNVSGRVTVRVSHTQSH